jgi:tetratricopeptide (TPR) repeat protein
LAALVAAGCLLAPISEWNARVTGDRTFVPSSGGLNVYLGNNADVCATSALRPGLEWSALVALPEQHGESGFSGQSRFFYSRVLEYATGDPGGFLHGLGRKGLQLVGSREIPRTLDVYMWREWSNTLAALIWKLGPFGFPFGVLFPLAALGIVFRWRALGVPLLLFLASYGAAIVLVFVTSRYRVPMAPALAVAAAAGLQALLGIVRARDVVRAALAAALLLGTLALITLPGPFCEEQINMRADFYSCLGYSQQSRGQGAEALESYLAALDAEPGSWRTHYDLGVMYAAAGELERAEAHYRDAMAIDPSWPHAHANLAVVRERRGSREAAIPHYRRALAEDARFSLARRNLVRLYLDLGRPGEAIETLQEGMAQGPGLAVDYIQLGRARLAVGETDEAIVDLRRGIEMGAVGARSRYELGMALLVKGDAAGALQEFLAVLAEAPGVHQAHYGKGLALAMLERPAEAELAFREAVALSPDFVDARIGLAESLRRQGDDAGAADELRRVLAEHPGHPVASERLEAVGGP